MRRGLGAESIRKPEEENGHRGVYELTPAGQEAANLDRARPDRAGVAVRQRVQVLAHRRHELDEGAVQALGSHEQLPAQFQSPGDLLGLNRAAGRDEQPGLEFLADRRLGVGRRWAISAGIHLHNAHVARRRRRAPGVALRRGADNLPMLHSAQGRGRTRVRTRWRRSHAGTRSARVQLTLQDLAVQLRHHRQLLALLAPLGGRYVPPAIRKEPRSTTELHDTGHGAIRAVRRGLKNLAKGAPPCNGRLRQGGKARRAFSPHGPQQGLDA
mmetsp:Transcript_74475/g.206851  ORF Transcript_74475/g.206851 Transcript_74475/m.206851 type:complete len:270 (+) Transcript_74475:1820-2629(+)